MGGLSGDFLARPAWESCDQHHASLLLGAPHTGALGRQGVAGWRFVSGPGLCRAPVSVKARGSPCPVPTTVWGKSPTYEFPKTGGPKINPNAL